jgi:hypothetical protein
MVVASSRKHLGRFAAPAGLKLMGWLATGMMALAATAMVVL